MMIKLKRTDLKVSRLCFGTMTFGKPADQQTSTRMVDQCIEAGLNFFDTANMYQLGVAASMRGEALKGRREKQILATKVRFKMGEGADEGGLPKRAIFRAIEDSLKRLRTDFVDIYDLHFPDYAVPIEETLDALELRMIRLLPIMPRGNSAKYSGLPKRGTAGPWSLPSRCTTFWRAAWSRNGCP